LDGQVLDRWKKAARRLEHDTYAVWLAVRDPRVPWYARAIGLFVVAYAVSPIDLIPDFIPVIGYLDDMVVVPLGIALMLRLIPPQVMAEARARADEALDGDRPGGHVAATIGSAVIIAVWLVVAGLAVFFVMRRVRG
jgi:uncharacterized membrane protein YkvA (DUF1232 family)